MGKRQPCQGPVQPKVSAHNQRGQRWKITEAMQKPRWRSPDVILRQHIEKQLVEPSVSITRHTEEIPFTDVRVSQGPIRVHRSLRRQRHHQWALATDLCAKMELVPPLPVTKTTDTSCHLPANP
ncbi:band 4.1-like protein 4A isoform X1 [Solea solea]|uniref:band 4.1-like protein 4A isoform X1 n=1 Tax=Solea solea TaxID=90069 RepID=UPI00272A8E77|nr:band 4.1-like protein 4A isoform X1 [Solea solea]XP_058473010.1 band 4.1-like protein 4A isoform X1 [Solea solea]XP_058473011.1 band 4.1-like protein 4A isoform X1 [Solea solea]